MTGDYADIHFSTVGKNGKPQITTLKVEKGVTIDMTNSEGYYENSYTINENGEIVAKYTPDGQDKVVSQIEATSEQINRLYKIQNNQDDGGLSKKDYEINERNRVKAQVAKDTDNATIYTYKKNHPFLGLILPDVVIKRIAK